jgi:hypothetical protein
MDQQSPCSVLGRGRRLGGHAWVLKDLSRVVRRHLCPAPLAAPSLTSRVPLCPPFAAGARGVYGDPLEGFHSRSAATTLDPVLAFAAEASARRGPRLVGSALAGSSPDGKA